MLLLFGFPNLTAICVIKQKHRKRGTTTKSFPAIIKDDIISDYNDVEVRISTSRPRMAYSSGNTANTMVVPKAL